MHIRHQLTSPPSRIIPRLATGRSLLCTVGGLAGVRGCFGVGGPAGVQHQHRHPRRGEQLAEGRPVSQLLIGRVTRILEDQVPVLPGPHRPRHRGRVPQRRHPHPTTITAAGRPATAGRAIGSGRTLVVLALAVILSAVIKRSEVEVGAVPVEVHHMVRPAGVSGLVQDLGEAGVGGGAQHVQVQAGHLLGAAADQPGGHRPERHIITTAGAADHQQHPQPVPARLRQAHPARGLQVGADELTRAQRHRGISARVAQQFPRQARDISRIGVHLHPDPRQPGTHVVPDARGVQSREHVPEQAHTGTSQDRLSVPGQAGGGVGGELRVVL